jgi:3-oxoacyl-[acyl-carrier-protein] synthase-3
VPNVKILGTGKYLPRRRVPSEELDARLGLAAGTVATKTGVKVRHHADGESVAEMAVRAAAAALDEARTAPGELDLIVSAGASPIQLIPCNATLIQRQMGLGSSGIPAFDIDATCLSFQVALDFVGMAVAAGRYRRALVVSSEWASRALNWQHLESAGLFGDGAAAVVLGPAAADEASAILASRTATFADHADLCQLYGGGSALPGHHYTPENRERYLFDMDGPGVFKAAARLLPEHLQKLFESVAPVSLDDVRMVVPHQASLAAMTLMRRRLGIPEERWLEIIETHGNCIAASVPMALHEALKTQRVQRGDLVLLIGTGAGLSLGLTLLRL